MVRITDEALKPGLFRDPRHRFRAKMKSSVTGTVCDFPTPDDGGFSFRPFSCASWDHSSRTRRRFSFSKSFIRSGSPFRSRRPASACFTPSSPENMRRCCGGSKRRTRRWWRTIIPPAPPGLVDVHYQPSLCLAPHRAARAHRRTTPGRSDSHARLISLSAAAARRPCPGGHLEPGQTSQRPSPIPGGLSGRALAKESALSPSVISNHGARRPDHRAGRGERSRRGAIHRAPGIVG